MLTVQIKITGDEREIKRLNKLGGELKNFNKAMKEIGRETKDYFAGQAFASQGGVYSKPWKGLSPVYNLSKAKRFPGRGPLIKSGDMQKSFVFNADRNSVTITNTSPHFGYHQSTKPRNKIPRRQMIGVNADVKGIVRQILKADIKRKIKG